MDECWPDEPGWYEAKPSKPRPAVAVIGLLWIVVPCLLLLSQYADYRYDSGWKEFSSQVSICSDQPTDPAKFQEMVVVTICDPAWSLVDRVQILSDSTEGATNKPDGFDDEVRRSRVELESLLGVSHRITVPLEHRQHFQLAQLSLLSASQSLDALEVAVGSPIPADKSQFYAESVEQTRAARDQLWEARKHFESFVSSPQICSPPGYSDG